MSDQAPLQPGTPCPICTKPAVPAFRPFCSARCADVDLNRWLSGAYVIPGDALEEEDVPDSEEDRGRDE